MFLSRLRRRVTRSFALIFVIALPPCFSIAQISKVSGAVQGTVLDQSGGAIPGATITLRNDGTNRTRTFSSSSDGSFRVGELPADQYQLRVESPGFSTYVNSAIVVAVGTVVRVKVQLAPATVQQQITVSEEPSLVATASTLMALGTTTNSQAPHAPNCPLRPYMNFR
jgi:hypothetical protein